ncbi:opsin, ultraviolet-sensitive-like [Artemia franciscana]
MIIMLCWLYSTPFTLLPFFEVWGRFVPEGFLTSCTFDYITEDSSTRFFVATIFFTSYCIPMSLIIFFYSRIVGQVWKHEQLLKEQAKKMNVESLRSSKDQSEQSAEIRIAKVAIGIVALFVVSWTPYAIVALTCTFGNRAIITPVVSMIPACTCKTVACVDPWVYAINHPRFRLELQKRMPWFCIHEEEPKSDATSVSNGTSPTTPS